MEKNNDYIEKLVLLTSLQHKQQINSSKAMKLCFTYFNNEEYKKLVKENEEIEKQIAQISVDIGLYKSLEDYCYFQENC